MEAFIESSLNYEALVGAHMEASMEASLSKETFQVTFLVGARMETFT
jgi:hypothetical protein